MNRRLILLLAVAGLLALSGGLYALVAMSGSGTAPGRSAAVDDPHRDPGIPQAQRTRILRAVDAVSQDVPTAELAAEGRAIFRSSAVALDGETCQSCHTEGGSNSGADPAGGTLGLGTIPHESDPLQGGAIGDPQIGFTGLRDAPALYGVGETDPFGWAGGFPTLEGFALNAVTNHFHPPDRTPHNIAALVAFMKTIQAPTSDFDRGTLSAAALRGQLVFQNQGGCIGCHLGPNFTDGLLNNIGVPQPPGATDSGFAARVSDSLQCGTPAANAAPDPLSPSACFFNTAGLRGVARTAPYFHNGIAKNLRQVVNFYNGAAACGDTQVLSSVSTIAPLGLTCQDENDLIEYLKSL